MACTSRDDEIRMHKHVVGDDAPIARNLKDKEGKKSQHQVKVKEIKIKPVTDDHDIQIKIKHAREFIAKGNKVRVTCSFRGRELAHPEIGHRAVRGICEALADIATPEAEARLMGKTLSTVLAPGAKKKVGSAS